jgi:hypothetical protein
MSAQLGTFARQRFPITSRESKLRDYGRSVAASAGQRAAVSASRAAGTARRDSRAFVRSPCTAAVFPWHVRCSCETKGGVHVEVGRPWFVHAGAGRCPGQHRGTAPPPDSIQRLPVEGRGFEHSRAVRWKESQMYVDRAEYLVRLADALTVDTVLLVAIASGATTFERA